jgi:hypothetical protein
VVVAAVAALHHVCFYWLERKKTETCVHVAIHLRACGGTVIVIFAGAEAVFSSR